MKKIHLNLHIGTGISSRQFITVTSLISGTLAWFFLLQDYYLDIFVSSTNDGYWASVGIITFYGFGALSAIVGSSIADRLNRRKLLGYWIAIATLATASLAVFHGDVFLVVFSILLGFCLGMGFPSCAALFADLTVVEERARVAGLIILVAFILTFLGVAIIPILGLGTLGGILFLTLLRLGGFLSLVLDPCERKEKKEEPWSSILSNRNFAFFLLPWVMFNIAAGLLGWWDIPDSPDFLAVIAIGSTLATALMGISGLIGGSLADRFGRKQPIVISLVMFGVSFAVLSFTIIPESVFIYYATYGIAWGFLFTLYLTIPGDLALSGSKEKYYAIGTVTPLIIFMFISMLPELVPIRLSASVLSPILTIILFLSIIPVLKASETLPERKMRERRLKDHIEKVGKLVSKSKKKE